MKREKYLYWNYFTFLDDFPQDILVSFFDVGDYKDKFVFLHLRDGFIPNIEVEENIQRLADYMYKVSKTEEDWILDGFGQRGKEKYAETLKSLGIGENYKLYSFTLNDDSVKLLSYFLGKILNRPVPKTLNFLDFQYLFEGK